MTTQRWGAPAFGDEVRSLVADTVGEPTSTEVVRQRPWSVVWRAETSAGTWFVKDNCPSQAHEAALLTRLGALAPGRTLPVVGARGSLFVAADHGEPVGERADGDLDLWCRIVVAAAELQREVAAYAGELGLVTIAPHEGPAWVAAMVGHLAALPSDDPRRLPEDDATRLRALQPQLQAWADQVAALGLPLTLLHNDLHAHNVFAVDDRLVLFDLGDAVVMEPLAGLLIPLRVLAHQLDAGPGDPRVLRVAEAGLEVWSDLAPAAELRAALPAALQLACLGRVESWHRVTEAMTPTELVEWGRRGGRLSRAAAGRPARGPADPLTRPCDRLWRGVAVLL